MRRLTLIPLTLFLLIPAAAAAPRSTAPMQFTLVDTVTGRTNNGSTGTFAASGLICPSGTFADDETPVSIRTVHTCGDGSGEIDSIHYSSVGAQVWTFTGGTGSYPTLRGRGTCVLSGNNTVRTCQFLAAYDEVPPTGAISRLAISGRAVHVSFTAHDDVAGNAVTFKLTLRAGSAVATRKGSTTGGIRSFVVKLKRPRAARRLTVALTLTDPVGNARTLHRTKRL